MNAEILHGYQWTQCYNVIRNKGLAMDKIKVLVVDDKKVMADLFNFTLGAEGHVIRSVTSASEAMDAVQDEKFDIAFFDVIMPGIDGLMLLKKMRSLAPKLPVVMMSGYSLDDRQKELIQLGVGYVLKKPFEIDDVRQAIRAVLRREI